MKPENILLEKSEEPFIPKLADFGLAKNYHQAGLSGMTVTGSFAGTYDFMPREQLTNYKYLNPVSDLWSMAATYYFLATGCYPRTRRPGMDAIQVILSQDAVPIRSRNSEIPASVAQVIDRALQTEPEKRFGSAEEMLQALQ